jgi:hypothetical protein
MGCFNSNVEEDPLSEKVFVYIRNSLEGNLVKQTSLNAELNTIKKKFDENKEANPEQVVKEYSDLLINLTNTKTEKETNDIKELLTTAMKIVKNNFSSFYVLLFEKLQGLNDYSNVKVLIDKDKALKDAINENEDLLIKVFEELETLGITDISQLSFEKFKELCQKHGVKMTDEQLKNYLKLFDEEPEDGFDVAQDIKQKLEGNPHLVELIEVNIVVLKKKMQKINREGIDVSTLTLEEYKKLCKESGVKLKDEEIEEIFILIQVNYIGLLCYMDKVENKTKRKKESLLSRARKINSLAKINLQILPVAQKLDKFF